MPIYTFCLNAVFTIENKGADPRSDHSHTMTWSHGMTGFAVDNLNSVLDQTGAGRFAGTYLNAVPDQAGAGRSSDVDKSI